MSAQECFTSPCRASENVGRYSVSSRMHISCRRSIRLSDSPQPTLKTLPETPSAMEARTLASTTFSTKVKSRDCLPSPKIVGCSPLTNAETNSGITAEYGLAGSCRGPKILKYRSRTVSMSYDAANDSQYSSAASLPPRTVTEPQAAGFRVSAFPGRCRRRCLNLHRRVVEHSLSRTHRAE